MADYTADEILKQWDACAREFAFPMLDNGYIYPADVRLSAYRDGKRWAVIIEALGSMPRVGGHGSVDNTLYSYGNCLYRRTDSYAVDTRFAPNPAAESRRSGRITRWRSLRQEREKAPDQHRLSPTEDVPGAPIFADEFGVEMRVTVGSVLIRDRVVPFDVRPDILEEAGIPLTQAPAITCTELLRSLLPTHRDLLLATEEELRARVPADLRLFLRLDEWHHPNLVAEELPSESETFQMLAAALEAGDASLYRPTMPPNTYWSNWPEGGTL